MTRTVKVGYNRLILDQENELLSENLIVRREIEEETQETEENSSTSVITIDEAIDRLGMGPFQRTIAVASGLCFAADAMQVIQLAFLSIVLQKEWTLSNDQTASITSSVFAGALLGTVILGPLADRFGRRLIFLLTALSIFTFGMATAWLATNYALLLTTISLVGFGVGGLTVPFDLLAEFLPSSGRGKNLLMIQYFWTIGCLYVVLMAYATLHHDSFPLHTNGSAPDVRWRWFVTLCTLPCLLAWIIGYIFVPESTRWLVTQGRHQEAWAILREGARRNGHNENSVFPHSLRIREEEQGKAATVADLFTPRWKDITLRLWGTWTACAFGYYGTILVTTKVFESPDKQKTFDYSAIFTSSLAELLGTTFVVVYIDKAGRVPSQIISYASAGVAVLVFCVLASAKAPRLLLISLGFVARVFEMSGTCVTWVFTAEIFTTDIRGTGHSSANSMARLGAFFCPFLVNGNTSLMPVGVTMFIVHAFTVLCVYKLPETKGMSMGLSNMDEEDEDSNQNVQTCGDAF